VTIANTLISSVKVLAAMAWLKQTDLAGHWQDNTATRNTQHQSGLSQTVGHV